MPKEKFTYDYPRPCVTVDVVIFSNDGYLLCIERGKDPFKGLLALPGGHVEKDEDIDLAAERELREETGLSLRQSGLRQLFTVGSPYRDPRGWYITVVYGGFIDLPAKDIWIKAGDDAAAVKWKNLNWCAKKNFAFDHFGIIKRARAMFLQVL